ncbi:MAG: DUF6898 family protein [Rhodospirillales bacterium]
MARPPIDPKDVQLGPVLFEFVQQGAYVRVSAIDSWTNTEVTVVGNPAAGEAAMRRTALNKLRYVIAKGGKGLNG